MDGIGVGRIPISVILTEPQKPGETRGQTGDVFASATDEPQK